MKNVKILKLACYSANVSMAAVGNLSPLLFITFKELYGISYTLLGLLVLINFCTQLGVDLIFSFFSHKFNIEKTVKVMPIVTAAGLILYALTPVILPNNVYLGIVIGTVIASVGSGLAEVLISPTIAAIPSEDPDREMSKLHSSYAWGVVGVVIFSTLFLSLFGSGAWPILTAILAAIPIVSAILYMRSEIPQMGTPEKVSGAVQMLKSATVWLMVCAIFLGGASECTMAQWCSGYLERALGISKVMGDIFGVALFSVMLGLGRSLYGARGKNIERVLFLGALGASICYLTAALSPFPVIGLLACALTGFFVSMLWPGSLIVATERVPVGGVFMFALMAAGGDFGASVAPQLLGIITDSVSASPAFAPLCDILGITAEQLGMKAGMITASIFPIMATVIFLIILKTSKRKSKAKNEQ